MFLLEQHILEYVLIVLVGIAKYKSLFKQYADHTQLSNVDREVHYKGHLSSYIKDRLAESERAQGTFAELEKAVLDIDARYRERQAEKAREQGRSSTRIESPEKQGPWRPRSRRGW